MASLSIQESPNKPPRFITLYDETTVGRLEYNTVCIQNSRVSGAHATIIKQKDRDGYCIMDLNSRAGVFVNGEKVTRCFLKDGDQIVIGESILKFIGPPFVIEDYKPISFPSSFPSNHTNSKSVELKLASRTKRFLNFVLDSFFYCILGGLCFFIIFLFNTTTVPVPNYYGYNKEINHYTGFNIMLSILMFVLYYAVIEGNSGKTLAKFITKTKVVTITGEEIGYAAAFIRSLVRLIPFEAISFIDGPFGWHDELSNTRVVDDNDKAVAKLVKNKQELGSLKNNDAVIRNQSKRQNEEELESLIKEQARCRENVKILDTSIPAESIKRAEFIDKILKIEERISALSQNTEDKNK